MDILAATIANSIGAEQAGVRHNASEKTADGNGSFAESFDERIALDAGPAVETAANQTANELIETRNGAALQISDDSTATAIVVKARAAAGQGAALLSSDGETYGAVKNLNGAAPSAGGSQYATMFGEVMAESGGITGVATEGHAAMSDTPSFVSQEGMVEAKASEIEIPLSEESKEVVADQAKLQEGSDQPKVASPVDRFLVLRSAEESSDRKTTTAENREPTVSAKGASKDANSEAKRLAFIKSASTSNTELIATGKSIDVFGAQSVSVPTSLSAPVPVSVPVAPASIGDRNSKNRKASQDGPVRSGSAGQKNVAAPTAAKNEADVHDEKVSATGNESTKLNADGNTVSAKSGSEFAKATESAAGGADGDRKLHGAEGGIVLAHDAAGMTGSVAGNVSAHVAGVGIPAKIVSSDIGASTVAAHAGAAEHDGSGAMASPTFEGGHRTLMATPTTLEVGLSNGTQGWLKIRAEMAGGGGVNATLSASIPAGQEMLHRELPSLTAYLQQERVAVNAIVIHSPATAGAESHGPAGSMTSDGGGQAQQRNDQGEAGRQRANGMMPHYADEAAYEVVNAVDTGGSLSPMQYEGGGSWVSIRA